MKYSHGSGKEMKSMNMKSQFNVGRWAAAAALLVMIIVASCARKPKMAQRGDIAEAAIATYVAPGDLDEFYVFYSGGQSGSVFVAGIPSMRHIATIPVFTPYPGNGYGFDKETKAMLGSYTWGDVHHPALSKTNGDYDGRWLFVNDNANDRMARIDLRDFKTKQIFGPMPNVSGNHGSTFVTNNTEYIHGCVPFLDSAAQGHLRIDRRVRNQVPGRGVGYDRGSENRRDRHGLADSDAAV